MKKWLPKISLILAGVILSLILAEAFLHLVLSEQFKSSLFSLYSFPCYNKGSYYWYKLKSNSNCLLHSNLDSFADVTFQTNEMGLRNPPIKEKSPDTLRVLMIGDSFVAGMGVGENQAFPRLVEKELIEKTGQKIEVINAGLPGTGLDYYYLFLKKEGEKLNPDIVVIGFYPFNDYYDGEFTNYWSEKDSLGRPEKITSLSHFVDQSSGHIYSNTVPWFYRVPVIKDLALLRLMNKSFMPKDAKSELIAKYVCIFKPACHDLDQQKEQAYQLFKAIKEITETHGQKLVVVIIPAQFQVEQEARWKFDILVPLSPKERHFPHQQFGSFFSQEGIDYIDLLPIFLQYKEGSLYFEKDIHWNEVGHRQAAQVISDKIMTNLK